MKSISIGIISLFVIIACDSEISVNESDKSTSNENDTVYLDNSYYVDTMPVSDADFQKMSEQTIDSTLLPIDFSIKESLNSKKEIEKETIKNDIKKEVEGSKEIELIDTKVVKSSPQVLERNPETSGQKVKAEIHKTWDDLTKKHISSSGKVDYSGFVKDKEQLNQYIKELQSYHKDLGSWSKNKRLAYWINLYNAVTVKLIVDNYPVKSIKDINGGKPWDKKLINLGGVDYTLNVIENKIIRPKFNEPRIHFAVNCAAKSCPKILNRAWTEDNIQRYLTKQTNAFIANVSQNSISADKLVLSNIFNWYKTDFGKTDAKLIEFINKYSDTKVNSTAVIIFNNYDWTLNN